MEKGAAYKEFFFKSLRQRLNGNREDRGDEERMRNDEALKSGEEQGRAGKSGEERGRPRGRIFYDKLTGEI